MGLRLAHRVAAVVGSIFSFCALAQAEAPAPSKAATEHGPMALHWVRLPGTEGCIAGDALARDVEAKLQRPVFPAPRNAELLIEGHTERTLEGYRAELRMLKSDGTIVGSRVLNSAQSSCAELSETLGVVLAVMIDPEAEGRILSPEPVKPPPPPEPKPVAAPKPEPAPRPRADLPSDNRLGVVVRALLQVVPDPALGIGAVYERSLGAAGGLRLEIISFVNQRLQPEIDATGKRAELDLRLTYGGAAYCPLWLSFGRAHLAGCAGVELGAMNVHTSNLSRPVNRKLPTWFSGSAALRASVRLVSMLELNAGISFVATSKHVYRVRVSDGSDVTLARASSFGAALDLGLGARF